MEKEADMDLKNYFSRMRLLEQSLPGEYVTIVSTETGDGGRPGVITEVPRELAARMIIDMRARVASEEELRELRRPASKKG